MTLTPIRKSQARMVPVIKSDDPGFNQEYAQYVAELISKMDDDTAEMFAFFTMAEIVEQDIEKNRRTLQSHVNTVAKRCLQDYKEGLMRVVSKGGSEEALAYARAVEELERRIADPEYAFRQDLSKALEQQEISKAGNKNPYVTGSYQFEESDFRRDPSTGRFRTKVNVDESMSNLKPKQAASLGITGADKSDSAYRKLSPEAQAQFAQEYMQVVNFLNIAQGVGGSDAKTLVRVQNKKTGAMDWRQLNGKPKAGTDNSADWNPRQERVVEVEAVPGSDMKLGGAAFGLVPSLGANAVEGINTADTKFSGFAENWSNPQGDARNSNDRLYNRTKTGSQFLMDVTPNGSALNTAARAGKAVGEHGQSAEKVFGPAARRTAYRYRGTEKTPDAEAVRQYELVRNRAGRTDPDLDEKSRTAIRTAQTRAVNRALENKAIAYNEGRPPGEQKDRNAFKLLPQERVQAMNDALQQYRMESSTNDPNSEVARSAGRQVLAEYLMDEKRPGRPKRDKNLYNLQLQSGVTPPSEGFIVDKDGEVVAQAVGYGDDHYLPFNIKNLKKLRGGEYIRSRSVGGPTTEDIYTGLMAGADRVTVVSRSGTYTVKFADDFKGKRRYNDKAMRMTGRYAQLLDTVQSETVERSQQVSPEVRAFLQAEVDKEFGWADRGTKREALKQAVNEYKEELSMTSDDEADFNSFFSSVSDGMGEGESRALKAQMYNDWQAHNEFKFRLNGAGYRDAMLALEEQFPYYFQTDYQPNRQIGRIETERDKGYVEPSRNRPTAASAGFFGTETNKGQKFSASHANHQRGNYGGKQRPESEGPNTTSEDIKTPDSTSIGFKPTGQKSNPVVDRVAERQVQNEYVRTAVAFRAALKDATIGNIKDDYEILNMSSDKFEAAMDTPEGRRKWEEFVEDYRTPLQKVNKEQLNAFSQAAAMVDLKNYDERNSHRMEEKPFKFPGEEFKRSADVDTIDRALTSYSRQSGPVSSTKQYKDMSLEEMKTELRTLVDLKSEQAAITSVNDPRAIKAVLDNMGIEATPDVQRLVNAGPNAIQTRINNLHKVRTLKSNKEHKPAKPGQPAPQGGTPMPRSSDPARPGTMQKPLRTGVKVSRGNPTDIQVRIEMQKDLKKLQEAATFADGSNDEERLSDLSEAITIISDTLQEENGLTMEQNAVHKDRMRDLGFDD